MTYILTEDHAIDRDGRRYPITKTLRGTLNAAEQDVKRYRSGETTWPTLYRSMLDAGFYGVFRFGPNVVAYYNGVRFEL